MSKRKAEKQLTDRDDIDDENSEEEETGTGTWKAASAQTMATRKIVRAPRRSGSVIQESVPEQKDVTTSPAHSASSESNTSLPSFSLLSSSATDTKWPSFSFSTSSEIKQPEFKWPTFSFASAETKTDEKKEEKKDEKDEKKPEEVEKKDEKKEEKEEKKEEKQEEKKEEKKEESKWPTFFTSNPSTLEVPSSSFSFMPKEKSGEWPTFSFSSTSPAKQESVAGDSPFQLLGTFGTLHGVGRNAKETVALTATGTGRWLVPEKDKEKEEEPGDDNPEAESPTAFSSAVSPSGKYKKVENHKTGEEEETSVVEVRVKIFELGKDDKGAVKWTERGTGPLKLNSRDEGKKSRMLMRSDNALRVILNAVIFETMKYDKVSDKQLKFTCLNTGDDGASKLSTFLIKVATAAEMSTITSNLDKLIKSAAGGKANTTPTKTEEKKEEKKE